MIRINRTKIGHIWRDPTFHMAIGYIALAAMFTFIATSKSQFKYLFLMVPVALICAGVMTWMFIHNTDAITIYDDDHDDEVSTRHPDHTHQEHDHRLARRAQEVIVGLGLTQTDFSIAAGRIIRIPQVISVTAGPPVGLHIRTLPGQTPDDFAAHAPALAYNLGVPKVHVVPLGPSLIRLDLLPETGNEIDETAYGSQPSLS